MRVGNSHIKSKSGVAVLWILKHLGHRKGCKLYQSDFISPYHFSNRDSGQLLVLVRQKVDEEYYLKCPTSWIFTHNEVKLLCQFVPHDTSLSWACIVIHRCLWWIWPFLGSWRLVRVTFDRKPAGARMPLPPWPKVFAWPICTPTCLRFCTCTCNVGTLLVTFNTYLRRYIQYSFAWAHSQ